MAARIPDYASAPSGLHGYSQTVWQNSPLLRRRQPAVIANQIPQRRIQRERAVHVRESGHAWDHRKRGEARRVTRTRHVTAAGAVRSRRPRAVQDRYVLAVFRPAAPRRSRALLQGQHVRAVLVGDQIQRHHGDRDQSCGVLLGVLARRHHHPRRPTRSAPRKLHRDGPAAPRGAAQDRGADVHADPSRPARDQHPQALGRVPRQSAAWRGVRLGRPGLDRADHADARRAVRLPLGGPPQADALVGHRDHAFPAPAASSPPKTSGRPS